MYSASLDNNGSTQSKATTKDYTFMIDTAGKGANPVETVLAGLCGCMAHWIGDYMRSEQIDGKGFTVKAEADLTAAREKLSDITVRIAMKDMVLDGHRREQLLQHVRNCPVYNTLKANSNIEIILSDGTQAPQDIGSRL